MSVFNELSIFFRNYGHPNAKIYTLGYFILSSIARFDFGLVSVVALFKIVKSLPDVYLDGIPAHIAIRSMLLITFAFIIWIYDNVKHKYAANHSLSTYLLIFFVM